jgi:hypothetical protein
MAVPRFFINFGPTFRLRRIHDQHPSPISWIAVMLV